MLHVLSTLTFFASDCPKGTSLEILPISGESGGKTCLVLRKRREPRDIMVLKKRSIQAEVRGSTSQCVEAGNKVADATACRLKCSKNPVVTVSPS